jgi:hypothetical protein
MPTAEECYAARDRVTKRVIEDLQKKEGHPYHSAKAIATLMTHEQKCERLGIRTGQPHSPY